MGRSSGCRSDQHLPDAVTRPCLISGFLLGQLAESNCYVDRRLATDNGKNLLDFITIASLFCIYLANTAANNARKDMNFSHLV